MWLLNELAKLNARWVLMVLWLFKPCIRFNMDLLHMWELREIVCREIIQNGHPFFRGRK